MELKGPAIGNSDGSVWFLRPAHLRGPRRATVPPGPPPTPNLGKENMGSKPQGLGSKVPVWYLLASGTGA